MSVIWALLVNALLVLLLFLLSMEMPQQREESGVPVMMGSLAELDAGYEYTPVEPMPVPVPPSVSNPVPDVVEEIPSITQELEQTVAVDEGKKKSEKQVNVPSQLTPEQIKAQEEQKAREQAQQIANSISNVFANSRNMQASSGDSQTDETAQTPGSLTGNSTQGKLTGTGGYGTWDLGGRDLMGQLPKPAYQGINEEGAVVVTITVNPKGQVIDATINKRTNTSSHELREAALKAARSTRFSETSGLDNQTGTITYYFKLK